MNEELLKVRDINGFDGEPNKVRRLDEDSLVLYQHDLKPKELDEELDFVVSKIVNRVGVNVNNASESILSHVSGLDKKSIKSILDYRKEKGKINERKEIENILVNELGSKEDYDNAFEGKDFGLMMK